MIGLLVVSHSRQLAQAAVALAEQMVASERRPPIRIAAGLEGGELGTDATAVAAAIEELADCEGVLVMVDLGSAVLSAQMALELIDPKLASRVTISSAALVEGLVAAVVTASGGAPIEQVGAEARAGLNAKIEQVDGSASPAAKPKRRPTGDSATGIVWEHTLTNAHGLHARPAANLAGAVGQLDAQVMVTNVTTGAGPVDIHSVTSLASLGLRQGQVMRLQATGKWASKAREQIDRVLASGLDETGSAPAAPASDEQPIRGQVRVIRQEPDVSNYHPGVEGHEHARFEQALRQVTDMLDEYAAGSNGAIFEAQKAMLADPSLTGAVDNAIESGKTAVEAVSESMDTLTQRFERIGDPYLRERAQDLRSLHRLLLFSLADEPWRASLDVPEGIWVLTELDALTAAQVDTDRCKAIITLQGGDTGHGAIIARSRGISMLLGYSDASKFADGQMIEVDAKAGQARAV